jgi:hypothetical protein
MRIDYNTKVYKLAGVTHVTGPKVGIELEYEDCKLGLTDIDPSYWRVDTHHSLRNGGLELISIPLSIAQTAPALDSAERMIKSMKGKATKRCGVHVHLNVSDLTLMQLWQIMTYNTLLEPFIFAQFAKNREDSHFCVPTWTNTELQRRMYDDATRLHKGWAKPRGVYAHDGLTMLKTSKYSARNVAAIKKFGTLEFRQHRGSTDMNEVYRWVHFIRGLRQQALKYTSAEHILNEFEMDGYGKLCADVGLTQSSECHTCDVTDAVDAAMFMVGHAPTDMTQLDWELV